MEPIKPTTEEIERAYKALKLNSPSKEINSLEELTDEENRVQFSYRKLQNTYHSDKPSGINEISTRINNARDVLKNYFSELRKEFTEKNKEVTKGVFPEKNSDKVKPFKFEKLK
ncbi:MAG: hypothetical protein WCX88_00895 [Patescibacteria group bacterium]